MKDDVYDSGKKLYHYTNIESLYYILKNKTIRFNNLTKVNDLDEKESSDLGDFGKFAFVSCFTYKSEDNIPMWYMYSKGMTGVRLELPCDFFDYDKANEQILKKLNETNLLQTKTSFLSLPITGINMDYIKEEDFHYPQILNINNKDDWYVVLNKLGRNKKDAWKFEEECRYAIYTHPTHLFDKNKSPTKIKSYVENFEQKLALIDIPIKDEIIKEIKILLAPEISPFDTELVYLFADKFGVPAENIRTSSLTGKIRV